MKSLKKEKVKVKQLEESRQIPLQSEVRVTKMNHLVDVMYMARETNGLDKIKKLDKFRYMNTETGEIFECQVNENRGQNISGIKETMKCLRCLINNNFTGAKNELFITLTYGLHHICLKEKYINLEQFKAIEKQYKESDKKKEIGLLLVESKLITIDQYQEIKDNMKSTEYLYCQFDKFVKKMRYKYLDIDYINVVEPQGNGAWHCHVLMRFNGLDEIFIKNTELQQVWGNGFVKVNSLKNVDNIGAYVSAYLSDVEAINENAREIIGAYRANEWQVATDEHGNVIDRTKKSDLRLELIEKEVENENGVRQKKKFVKGARLHMYPSGMNIYRSSRGIKKPETVKMTYSELKKIVGSHTADYSKTILLERAELNVNSLTYENYNLKREKSKEVKTINRKRAKK